MHTQLVSAKNTFHIDIRIYYEDTDAGGIVYYANYLKFFERGRTEWLRACGLNQQHIAEVEQLMFVVKNASVDYKHPAKLDDEIRVNVEIEQLKKASIVFKQQAWCIKEGQSQLLAEGNITIACVNTRTLRPQAISEQILLHIKNYL